ncbi:tRNA epoxyqueuosine(34) reductase QueG [Alkalilimnicola ehrlichii]|uniref:Epoxyqueuosine reductase n=1 Tax=Alkalilimnicola ehrlichii TaxID=351052 RepID=A0A3E0WYF6_9GAMM|nr:tRNA epoxyqueuosine(34) reductase QueG [Alkalilimnicola ehrlichii]RFA30459.1 tRNA epoxyqueuosine(34) reductase QueG [Alkalilimnicola ehrlichii]RFA38012.1 tRNA epoxyqueuosine(34) reductase QueG [Alkalilimnicola ehrlichii]
MSSPVSAKNQDALRDPRTLAELAASIKQWGREAGFAEVGITGTDLAQDEAYLLRWLERQFHGDMDYMARHGVKRSRPEQLLPGTIRVISVRMDYAPEEEPEHGDNTQAFIARYARGRDYHKLIRKRLQHLATRLEQEVGMFGYRVFVDSAPVLEKALARNAGLGWIGKNTLLINSRAGSYFFLGEIYTDLPLPVDEPASEHCGSCRACLDICPTKAIVAPYQLDARLCISYLTIESHQAIPEDLRPHIGNRIFGCDDCQQVCPWNKFAQATDEADFKPRHGFDSADLIELFLWSEETFLERTAGSAIRRLGHERWLRNIAVALGNQAPEPTIEAALEQRRNHPSALVREHVEWALARLRT